MSKVGDKKKNIDMTKESQETESKEEKDINEPELESNEEGSNEQEIQEKDEEKYIRLMAEFQNYKKRVTKEKNDIFTYAGEEFIKDLLPVLDNFERALSKEENKEIKEYLKGMELIFKEFKNILEKKGLKEIDALGKDFDPHYHNAVMHKESEEYESGKVSEIHQKGYLVNERVIRPAMVTVSK